MTRTTIIIAAALTFTVTLQAAPAMAQRDRVFVASYGSDSNPCTFGSPCKTFQNAVDVVAQGGEVTAIDSAGFGPVTISHAVTITSPNGVEAGIAAPTGGDAAITINAGSSDVISLNGLTLNGDNVANTTGIQFNSGGSLEVRSSVIQNFGGDGIDFFPTGTNNLTVSNSQLSDNGIDGIFISPSGSSAVAADIDHVQVNHNGNDGVLVLGTNSTGTINVTVYDTVAARNGADGFFADTSSGHAPTTLMLFHSVSANNGFKGVGATGPGATLRVAHSTVTGNTNGWEALTSGVIQSYGDNYIDGNGPNTGSLTPGTKQ